MRNTLTQFIKRNTIQIANRIDLNVDFFFQKKNKHKFLIGFNPVLAVRNVENFAREK